MLESTVAWKDDAMQRREWLNRALTLVGLGAVSGCARGESATAERFEFELSETQWRQRLTPAQYHVLRDAGTERAGSSPLDREKRAGTFHCAGCDLPLFDSATKFESGTGWPSFWKPLPDAVGTQEDRSFFGLRTEVHCRRCGGHLGHVFDDGPPPTGLRYCMNGLALRFEPAAVEIDLS
jgi:peptide-methionine (R)-S-oxide reductase